MKKLHIVFHVGYGKTGTTWLQKNIFPKLNNCLYLGKFEDNVMLNDDLKQAHSKLFNPMYGLKRYRSRNSYSFIKNYVDLIYAEILLNDADSVTHSENGISSVVLSNETILSYNNYNAELNTYILSQVISKLSNYLSKKYKVRSSILITFREQCSVLQSNFAYDYIHHRDKFETFDKFIEYGIRNNHEGIFGSLWNDEIHEQLSNLFEKTEVVFCPYEYINLSPQVFFEKSLVALGLMSMDEIDEYMKMEAENVNINKDGSHKLRSPSIRARFFQFIGKLRWFLPESWDEKMKRLFPNQIMLTGETVITGNIEMNNEQREMIQNLYRKSNDRMSKLISIDLGELGYSVSSKR